MIIVWNFGLFFVNDTKRNLIIETFYLWMRHGVKLAKFGHADVVPMQHTNSSFISMAITIIWCTKNCDNLAEQNIRYYLGKLSTLNARSLNYWNISNFQLTVSSWHISNPYCTHSWLRTMYFRLFRDRNCFVISGPKTEEYPLEFGATPSSS